MYHVYLVYRTTRSGGYTYLMHIHVLLRTSYTEMHGKPHGGILEPCGGKLNYGETFSTRQNCAMSPKSTDVQSIITGLDARLDNARSLSKMPNRYSVDNVA